MNKEHSSANRQGTVYAYASLIETIAKQEYYRIDDPRVSFMTVARLAALAVRVAMLSGNMLNTNLVASLIRDTIRQGLIIYYSV